MQKSIDSCLLRNGRVYWIYEKWKFIDHLRHRQRSFCRNLSSAKMFRYLSLVAWKFSLHRPSRFANFSTEMKSHLYLLCIWSGIRTIVSELLAFETTCEHWIENQFKKFHLNFEWTWNAPWKVQVIVTSKFVYNCFNSRRFQWTAFWLKQRHIKPSVSHWFRLKGFKMTKNFSGDDSALVVDAYKFPKISRIPRKIWKYGDVGFFHPECLTEKIC